MELGDIQTQHLNPDPNKLIVKKKKRKEKERFMK